MSKKLVVSLLMILSPFMTKASDSNFYENLSQWESCSDKSCEAYQEKVLLDSEANLLTPELYKELMKAAEDQARVWGDTILEGDYISVGETVLNEVTAVYKSNQPIGYLISYSQEAYYTGSCDYDWENEETLEDCDAGHISERSYVSPDLKEWSTSENGYAEFDN